MTQTADAHLPNDGWEILHAQQQWGRPGCPQLHQAAVGRALGRRKQPQGCGQRQCGHLASQGNLRNRCYCTSPTRLHSKYTSTTRRCPSRTGSLQGAQTYKLQRLDCNIVLLHKGLASLSSQETEPLVCGASQRS